ncbi:MAG: hypothetical protein HXK60_02315 [Campylobacter sp.]|nr:hypothetical protein [Campylobacter sp.]
MKFKIILLALIASLNLSAFEPLSPDEAMRKFASDFLQINDYPLDPTIDYGNHTVSPSFACYDTKGNYKFKKYSLEDFICQSDYNSFRDNYFADLYNLIIKEAPNLKEKAQKVARERIKDSKKECIRYSKKEYDYSFVAKSAFFVSESIYCVKNFYREYTAKLSLMLYKNDKELFKRIYGKDYEKFKEVFEDTLKYVPIENGSIPRDVKRAEINNDFLQKYKSYHYDDDYPQIDDMLYIMLVQYSLIDKNGHLVLPLL